MSAFPNDWGYIAHISSLMILRCGQEVVYGGSCSTHVLIAQKVEDQMVVVLARGEEWIMCRTNSIRCKNGRMAMSNLFMITLFIV
jgi:hypothetical protein